MEMEGIIKIPKQICDDYLCICVECGKEIPFNKTKWVPRSINKLREDKTLYTPIECVEPYCEECFEIMTDV